MNVISINDLLDQRNTDMWKKNYIQRLVLFVPSIAKKRARKLRDREHDFILPKVRTERFKRCFINRCLFIKL